MTDEKWFIADVGADFEESVRIDPRDDGRDYRLKSIDTYHVTDEAGDFLRDVFARLLGRSADMRSGANYWLYGHYGSGKSHLLSVLHGLMDSAWLRRRDDVWERLADGLELATLEDAWKSIHDEYEVVPIPVDLLPFQGQKERSFSEVILSAAHASQQLTGVEGGFSPQLDVAYFEDWYRTTDAWTDRTEHARSALDGAVDDPDRYDWEDVQQYGALADVVLPRLFEAQTGTADGLDDLTPSDLDPGTVVSRLEELRSEREAEVDRPVKLVLLLDEVSLFIGADFDRLTELQTLAESVDAVGDGDIQLVATAQAEVEDVQPQVAAQGADVSIVKDRFPHRFALPSRHVGEIAMERLLKKTETGRRATERVLERTSNEPETLLVYSGVEQNAGPPLDDIDRELLIDFYPFRPYQPALFLEVLSNLRKEAHDPAKSIFSETARPTPALVHELLQEWLDDGAEAHVVSLVDCYDLVESEVEDSTPQDAEVIEEIQAKYVAGDLAAIDVSVAKAVLLLQHVPEMIPMTERNLAVAVLSDLDGPTQFQIENRVEESLKRLRKFVRPTHDEVGPTYTFADQEERAIYEGAEQNLDDPDWDSIVGALDRYLWADIARELSFPTSAEYGDTGERYPVRYEFSIDGIGLDTTVEAADALDVDVAIGGLSPTASEIDHEGDPLEWTVGDVGLADLRDSLVEWWALRAAVGDHPLPESAERDLSKRAARARSKVVEALKSGTFAVRDRTDIRGPAAAVEEFVAVRYPDDFHPAMVQIGEERLQELLRLTAQDPLPEWARRIEVATESPESHGGSIQNNVRAFTGQQLTQSDGSLAMAMLLDEIVDRKPIYEDARPALRAIIWGLCRKGDFLPVDQTGDSLKLDTIIDPDGPSTTQLKIAEGNNVRETLEEGRFIGSTETVPDGIVRLQEANETLAGQLGNLAEDAELVAEDDIETRPVRSLLEGFVEVLDERRRAATERREAVKSGGIDWSATVENTNAAQEWYEDAEAVWNLRLPALAQLDAQLALIEQSYGWLTDNCETAGRNLHQRIDGYAGEWWTHDGWDRFNDTRTVSPSLDDAIEAAWDEFLDATDVDTLVADLREHPWVRPLSEFESNVRHGFLNEYVTPLYRAADWHDDVSKAVTTVTGGTTSAEADDCIWATNTLVDTDTLDAVAGGDVDQLRATFDDLREIVGDRGPSAVAAVGVLPPDRGSIDAELERLAERHDFSIERTERGVIVR